MQEATELAMGVTPGGTAAADVAGAPQRIVAPAGRVAPARGGRLILVVIALAGLGLIGVGANMYRELQAGEPAKATVTGCDVGRRTVRCVGTWTLGGSLLQGGRVERGSIDGAGPGDVGKTIDVLVSGDRAYTNSIEQPSIAAGVGVVLLALAAFIGLAGRRRRPAAPVAAT